MVMNTAKNLISLAAPLICVRYDGNLLISTGRSRYETAWKNRTIQWSALLSRLAKSMETPETHAEYMKMGKEQRT